MKRLNHAGRPPSEDPRDHFAFRLERSRIQWLRTEAGLRGQTLSEFVRELLSGAIKRHRKRVGR